MFVTSAVLLYIAVSLLARVRPNIHILPAEPESIIISRPSEEIEVAGVGRRGQVRGRSPDREYEHDVLHRIPPSFPED
jgi:hypothetical protein